MAKKSRENAKSVAHGFMPKPLSRNTVQRSAVR